MAIKSTVPPVYQCIIHHFISSARLFPSLAAGDDQQQQRRHSSDSDTVVDTVVMRGVAAKSSAAAGPEADRNRGTCSKIEITADWLLFNVCYTD